MVGWTGVAIEQDDAGVRVGIVSQGGERMVLEAEYAVGCDGSHSNVRAQVASNEIVRISTSSW